ncbi:DedA family protein [Hwanghaeella grinnelliae]|uniref:DedA family protein n=1 Tax=Hwanghaeella grinnelliae TaxID=2500179 RepID=A0A437QQ40_9PROT|nr:YqaA family protein [Hwanghaeella grinnelliae]RVU36646.1 DedA family protein [Hwanghaeella grinnelliae]
MIQTLFSPLRRLYDWTMRMAAHPLAERYLAFVSFIESVIFPIPPDVMLIPMVLANRDRFLRYATICTIASVVGGVGGYLIGYGLFDVIGEPIVRFYGYEQALEQARASFAEYGWLIVIGGGLTPLPFKIVTIASGAMELNLMTFVLASILSRGLRFYIVSILLRMFGGPIRTLIEERFGLMTTAFFILLIGGFMAIKWLH